VERNHEKKLKAKKGIKMKREDISKIFEGATDEQINAILNINSADIGKAKSKVEGERDNYKSQLETATEPLKTFEGVDVKDLQGKITSLNQQLADQKADFYKQTAERDFNDMLVNAIKDSKAKNVKAVRALLDLEALRASKNQSADISAALEKVKEENDYLFVSDEPIENGVFTGGSTTQATSKTSDAMRAVMGLSPEK
jgi:Fe2+ transport system protein B